MLVAISGKAGSGKSTLAHLLAERLPGARVYSFADALRDEVAREFGIPREWTKERKLELMPTDFYCPVCNGWQMERPMLIREVLQEWGAFKRSKDLDYWIKRLDDRIRAEGARYAIIDDLRYQNELEWVRASEGVAVRVEPLGWRLPSCPAHVSETELDEVSFQLKFKVRWGQAHLEDLADTLTLGGDPEGYLSN